MSRALITGGAGFIGSHLSEPPWSGGGPALGLQLWDLTWTEFILLRPIPSKRSSCPTKLAKGLATGLPVVCNRGIGDLDDIVEREGVGVFVDGFSEAAYSVAA